MKKFLSVLAVIVLAISPSLKGQTDNEKEKAAILKMLDDEVKLFIANDLEGLASIHVQDELDTRLCWYKDLFRME